MSVHLISLAHGRNKKVESHLSPMKKRAFPEFHEPNCIRKVATPNAPLQNVRESGGEIKGKGTAVESHVPIKDA